MEISSNNNNSIKFKNKSRTILVNPEKKTGEDVSIILHDKHSSYKSATDGIIVSSPGDYEFGGIKIQGKKIDESVLYQVNSDGIEMLIGRLSDLKKVQNKLQDTSIICVDADEDIDPGFITNFVSNIFIIFGTQAENVVNKYHKDTFKKTNKIAVKRDKLPEEVESLLIA